MAKVPGLEEPTIHICGKVNSILSFQDFNIYSNNCDERRPTYTPNRKCD